jgi:hypothetical protein
MAAVKKHDDIGHRRLRELECVAERLNDLSRRAESSDPKEQEYYEAWRITEAIVSSVSSKSLAYAAEQFNVYAAAHPFRLKVDVGLTRTKHEHAIPVFSDPLGEIGFALGQLWRAYFHAQGWTRLKRCPICRRWFVDLTSDTRKQRCSVACTNLWWSYSKRKQANYTRFKKGGYHGRKTHR